MKRFAFALVALLGFAAVADACPGAVAARARHVFRLRAFYVPVQVAPANSFPRPMPSTLPMAPAPKKAVTATKVTTVYTVRTMAPAVAAVKSATYKPVAPVRKAFLFLGSVGGCPGGNCPR